MTPTFAVVGPFSGFKTGGPKKPSLFHGGRGGKGSNLFVFSLACRSRLKTLSGGEFGWGGTSVKR